MGAAVAAAGRLQGPEAAVAAALASTSCAARRSSSAVSARRDKAAVVSALSGAGQLLLGADAAHPGSARALLHPLPDWFAPRPVAGRAGLGGVLAYGEMLYEDTPVGSPLKRYARNVLIAANRGRGLAGKIRAYSSSRRGKRVPVDVAQVVAETLEMVRGSLPAAVRLEPTAAAFPLLVIGDATQLHQVVMNLCSNAFWRWSTRSSSTWGCDRREERGRPGKHVRDLPAAGLTSSAWTMPARNR
jgi:signal transduction histidine kinase